MLFSSKLRDSFFYHFSVISDQWKNDIEYWKMNRNFHCFLIFISNEKVMIFERSFERQSIFFTQLSTISYFFLSSVYRSLNRSELGKRRTARNIPCRCERRWKRAILEWSRTAWEQRKMARSSSNSVHNFFLPGKRRSICQDIQPCLRLHLSIVYVRYLPSYLSIPTQSQEEKKDLSLIPHTCSGCFTSCNDTLSKIFSTFLLSHSSFLILDLCFSQIDKASSFVKLWKS